MSAPSDADPVPASEILHASTVAVDGKGVLILGPSGSGKSTLAMRLIAAGATLVADDRTVITREGDRIIAGVPEAIAGLIEARGVGILRLPHQPPAPVELIVDLSQREPDRLPLPHYRDLLGVTLPCLHDPATPHFHTAIILYIRGSRKEPR